MTYQPPEPLAFTSNRLEGRVIFVTGAASGIGRAAVARFAAEGAKVVAASRRMDRLAALAAELKDQGRDVFAVACDVRAMNGDYAASKWGLAGLTKCVALEFA